MIRPIAIGLSPNLEWDDVRLSIRIFILSLFGRKNEDSLRKAENILGRYFPGARIFLFSSARSAMYILFKSLDIKGNYVACQAFTCSAALLPAVWNRAKIKFIDIDNTYNISPEDFKKKAGGKVKAVIVQHTFGTPAKMSEIMEIARKNGIFVVEDLAHSLGSTYKGNKCGSLGDAAVLSFGRDKVISSVFGGALVITDKNKTLIRKINAEYSKLENPGNKWTLKQVLHPIMSLFFLSLYNLVLGKVLLQLLISLKLLDKPVSAEELSGGKPAVIPTKMPWELAKLMLLQFKKLERYNRRRVKTAKKYHQELLSLKSLKFPSFSDESIYLRFNLESRKAHRLFLNARKEKIILGSWYKNIIDPLGTDLDFLGYRKGLCPRAEEASLNSVNLPTYPGLKDSQIKKITDIIKQWS